MPLNDRDIAVLRFEEQWAKHQGRKEERIREMFEMSAARYYQVLNRVIDDPDALVEMPMLVHRLRRAREGRLAARGGRKFAR